MKRQHTHGASSGDWNAVPNAHRYKLERAISTSSPWTLVGAQVAGTSTTATGLKCNTLYHFRVSARGDGSPYSTTFGGASSGVSQSTSACRPTIAASLNSPFLKQAVRLAATTTAESGPVASYQWQEWSAGGWTNLGATTTYATRSVSTSTAGYRTFRVVAAYTSTTTPAATSRPVTIRWRPMSVIASSTPAFPQSGPPATSTVTLVAAAVAPSDAAYRWQEWTGGAWTNLGSTTTRQTVASSVRGTRKFRIEVSHAVVPSATSAPVYVTWDEWAIVGDLVKELSAAVATSTKYKTAQTALLSCMNGTSGGGPIKASASSTTPTYTSFDDILSRYATTTKAKMEGTCSSQATAMFSANASTTRAELAKLKASSTGYAALLDTPHGRRFEANAGDAATLKMVSYLGAATFEPGVLVAPLYDSSNNDGGAGGESITTPPAVIPKLGTGLDCLPAGVVGKDLSLSNKLVVLNCLVFSTPHSFWVGSPDGHGDVESLRTGPHADRWAWLAFGDWVCTSFFQGPVPSCFKHDVAWGSLKKFVSNTDDNDVRAEDDDTLDAAWNPRNKALADAKFKADIARHGCQNSDWLARVSVCPPVNVLQIPSNKQLSELYFLGVARINSKGWVYTHYDSEHIDSSPGFAVYQIPSVTDVRISIPRSHLPHSATYRVSWAYSPGSVETATVYSYRLCWEPARGLDTCRIADGDVLSYALSFVGEIVAFKSIAISPNHKRFVGLVSFYYPPQAFDLRYGE